jgi:hypothetical protein
MNEFHFFSECNLGDNVFHILYMRKTIGPDQRVYFYVKDHYTEELVQHLVGVNNILIRPLSERLGNAYSIWIATYPGFRQKLAELNSNFDRFYEVWFDYFGRNTGFGCGLSPDAGLFDIDYLKNPEMYGSWDCLLINSSPQSGQFDDDPNTFIDLTNRLTASGKTVITTQKIDGVPCTRDFNYSLVDIGTLSINCKTIVSINTSPIILCLNQYNMMKSTPIYVLDRYVTYSFGNIRRYTNFGEFDRAFSQEVIGD